MLLAPDRRGARGARAADRPGDAPPRPSTGRSCSGSSSPPPRGIAALEVCSDSRLAVEAIERGDGEPAAAVRAAAARSRASRGAGIRARRTRRPTSSCARCSGEARVRAASYGDLSRAPRPPSRARRRPGRRARRRCSPSRSAIRSRPRSSPCPTRGMERWLTQRLSARLGATPGRARRRLRERRLPVRRAGSSATRSRRPRGSTPTTDPWLPERLGVAAARGRRRARSASRGCAALARHLGERRRRAARGASPPCATSPTCSTATRCTGRSWSAAWARGGDATTQLAGRAVAAPARADRRARARPSGSTARARGCATSPALVDLPAAALAVRAHAAARRPARTCCARSPRAATCTSSSCTRRRRCGSEIAALDAGRRAAREDPTATLAAQPPARLVGPGRARAAARARRRRARRPPPPGRRTRAGTLLARLQADVARRPRRRRRRTTRAAARRRRPQRRRSTPATAAPARSRSCATRSCTCSPSDPTLEPRDVIVMCPDIETFAPLIQATFGAGEVAATTTSSTRCPPDVRPPDLRVRLADRSLRQTNPVLGVVARLLELADAAADRLAGARPRRPRAGPPALPARRRRPRAARGVGRRRAASAGASTPRTARRSSSTRSPPGTWRAGLDRLLVGVTMTEDEQRLFGGVLPLDDVDSGAIDLAGPLRRARRPPAGGASTRSPRRRPIAAWARGARRRRRRADRDARRATPGSAPSSQRLLDDVVARGRRATTASSTLAEVRALLAERLQGRPTRANFRTGHLTICTLVPMRSVPHRVVCLLGLDDGAFPRKAPRDGDDLLLADPHVGDRDAAHRGPPAAARRAAGRDRPADRHLHRQRRAHERRRARRRCRSASCSTSSSARRGRRRRASACVVAPSAAAVRPAQLRRRARWSPAQPWSFDRVDARRRARAARRARAPPRAVPARRRCRRAERRLVELDDLVRFVEHPVRAFLRQRLGISVGDYDDEVDDALPVELDGLEQWGVGERLLDARLAGADGRDGGRWPRSRAARCRPAQLGRAGDRRRSGRSSSAIARQARPLLGPSDAGVGRRQASTSAGGRARPARSPGVARRRCCDGHVLARQPAPPARRVGAAARAAARTRRRVRGGRRSAARVGRARRRAVTVARIAPLAARRRARAARACCVDLYDRGMREPLPLCCDCRGVRAAFARAGRRRRAREWESDGASTSEDREPEHVLVVRRRAARFDDAARRPRRAPDERWGTDEPTRFGRYARRLWDGLLACETAADEQPRVRRLRPAADRRHRARGQRRDRQDVHDRRARGALRRRGHAARRSCCS